MTALRILIVVALQTLALAYMIYDRQAMLNASRVVTLKVVPVDPRDIFRGDYVVLNYDISRLEPPKLDGDDTFTYGEPIFVTMRQQAGAWVPVAIAHKPFAVRGDVPIRGTIESFDADDAGKARSVSITYGIESYFVPEGTGHAIEAEARQGDLSVDAAIDPTGRAAIKAIRRGGQVFYVDGIF
jgi:uncharacterized membrane-anchored protein